MTCNGWQSERDQAPVLSHFAALGGTPDHVRAHVREQDRLRGYGWQVALERRPVEVVAHWPLGRVRLGNEKVGPMRSGDKRIDPFRVARVAEHLAPTGET